MIARAEWFTPRKFGWGLGIKSWQGWAYILGVVLLFAAISFVPMGEGQRPLVSLALVGLLVVDILMVMPQVYGKLDEREEKHQLIAERNASFAAVAFLAGYITYNAITAAIRQDASILTIAQMGPLIGLVLIMALVKGSTLMRLEHEN